MDLSIDKDIQALKEETIKIRRDIHKHPELGFQEFRTSQLVYDYLKKLGYEVEKVAGTGVIGVLKVSETAPTLALRADMDCLPLQELNQVEYASENKGKMHACGHDGHTAIALATAKILKQNKDKLKGNIKFLFQPAEEGPGGAEPMIKDGVLANPKVDAIIGLHLWNIRPVGEVVVKHGSLMASADEFEIIIKGKGGHGAHPDQTVDSIVVAGHVIIALQTIVSRNMNPLVPAVVTIGKIEGGSNFNIIAETTKLVGTVRTFKDELRDQIKDRMELILDNITKAFGGSYEFNYKKFYPPTINDKFMTQIVKESVENNNCKVIEDEMTMGAEDMSYFLQKVPGCYFLIGSANKEKGLDKPHHSPYFNFDENVLTLGTKIMVDSVFRYFETVSK